MQTQPTNSRLRLRIAIDQSKWEEIRGEWLTLPRDVREGVQAELLDKLVKSGYFQVMERERTAMQQVRLFCISSRTELSEVRWFCPCKILLSFAGLLSCSIGWSLCQQDADNSTGGRLYRELLQPGALMRVRLQATLGYRRSVNFDLASQAAQLSASQLSAS